MHVLMTGHNGYIGSVMAPMFLAEGFEVTGLDTGYFRECSIIPDKVSIPEICKDIRDLTPSDMQGVDAVVHLAALSNDPLGNLNAEWTEDINFKASVRLAELAKEAGVQRFLFSSSCIMYGMSEAAVVTEESPLDPKTPYATSKIKSERAISDMAGDNFSPTFMRNGTVYGLSPRMRFDTVLNDFVGSAVAKGKVVLFSDGKPWRPVVHVQDIARSFMRVLCAPLEIIHNQVFNNGAAHLNYQIIQLAKSVVEQVPGCDLEIRSEPDADQRTYKTDFSKIKQTFPDFEFRWTVRDGVEELYEAFKGIGLTLQDFEDRRFTRLRWIRYLIEKGRLDEHLHWKV